MATNQTDPDQRLTLTVAEEIRVWMTRRRMSGERLARELGVSPAWVSYRINGQVDLRLGELEKIAAALDVQVAALLPTRDSARATDKAYSASPPVRLTAGISRPRHLPIRCATRPAPTGQTGIRQPAHSGHGDRRPVIQPWTHGGVAA